MNTISNTDLKADNPAVAQKFIQFCSLLLLLI
jgi:hypothetical protein